MTQSSPTVLRKKWPLLALVLAAIVALIVVIWQLQTSPETNDAYVYADTMQVTNEYMVTMAPVLNLRMLEAMAYLDGAG